MWSRLAADPNANKTVAVNKVEESAVAESEFVEASAQPVASDQVSDILGDLREFIDQSLGSMTARNVVTSSEMTNVLLDLRRLITDYDPADSVN